MSNGLKGIPYNKNDRYHHLNTLKSTPHERYAIMIANSSCK